MIKSRIFAFMMGLALLVPCLSWGAEVVTFTTGSGGSVYYDSISGTIIGTSIPVLSVIGQGTPFNNGVSLSLVSYSDLLSFKTGTVTSSGSVGSTYIYSATTGGSVTIAPTGLTGILAAGDLTNATLSSGNFTGHFINTSLDAIIKAFYGVGDNWLGQLTLGTTNVPDITSTSFIPHEGSVKLTATPIPPSFLLLASGLLGAGLMKRKRIV